MLKKLHLWNPNQNIYFWVRGGTPMHHSLWQVTQSFWVFDSSLVKCQVTLSMPRKSISSRRFEWECLLSLRVWVVDFHQCSVSALPCSQLAHELCVIVLNFILFFFFLGSFLHFFSWWGAYDFYLPKYLIGNCWSVVLCLSLCVSGNGSLIAARMKKSSVLIGGSFPLQSWRDS